MADRVKQLELGSNQLPMFEELLNGSTSSLSNLQSSFPSITQVSSTNWPNDSFYQNDINSNSSANFRTMDLLNLLNGTSNSSNKLPDFSQIQATSKGKSSQNSLQLNCGSKTNYSTMEPNLDTLLLDNLQLPIILPSINLNNSLVQLNQSNLNVPEGTGNLNFMENNNQMQLPFTGNIPNDLNNFSCYLEPPNASQWDNSLGLLPNEFPNVQIPVKVNSQNSTKDAMGVNSQVTPDVILSQSFEEIVCFRCKYCELINISFSKEEALEHLLNSHQHELNKAQTSALPSYNAEIVSKNDQVHLHYEKSSENGCYSCGKCHQYFQTLPQCRKHISDVHNIQYSRVRVERPFAAKSANQNESLEIQAIATKEPQTAGDKKKAASKKKAKTNMEKMKGDGLITHNESYICEFKGCNIRFKLIENLEYHCKCHVGVLENASPSFACPDCGYRSESWSPMAAHLWRQHVIDLELHACDQCSFRTFSQGKLKEHKKIHGVDRAYKCDKCPKSFKTNKQLWTHKVKHLDSSHPYKVFECNVCNRRFYDKRLLRHHQKEVHQRLRPFICQCCNYAASSRSTIRLHMRQHTGEKPFGCDTCSYRTADHNSLRRHKMRHSGEKPYKCPYCEYACIQASTYKVHLRRKHPGMDDGLLFSCNICLFKTIKEDTYWTHVADHKLDKQRKLQNLSIENRGDMGATTTNEEPSGNLSLVQAVHLSLTETSNMEVPRSSN